ncbi:hypothetical protein Bca52824_006102 [Brassica carinata]|uniref:non-specific serine/threonine protein kinase n=1 Tax=Brassica carinata TaxID=52824 RepID=A0A8X7WSJ8_BRACI|nr:hypothetical protein Bca52824_006102 [Brassica carinata]
MDTARKLTVLLVPLLFGLFLVPSVPVRATTEFTFRGFKGNKSAIRIAGEAAVIKPDGLLRLTNRASNVTGTAFYHKPVRLLETNRIATRVGSFSTRFVFVIIPSSSSSGGFGFTFTLSPTPNRPNAGSAQYLGVLNKENNGDPRNHVFAVEFDTVQGSGDDTDKIGNDIGLNFNNRTSDFQEPVVYYQKDDPNKREDFELESGNPIQALLSYDGATQTLNVTIPKLLDVVQEEMYVGFTAATGKGDQSSDHYLMGWSFSSTSRSFLLRLVLIAALSAVMVIMLVLLFFFVMYKKRLRQEETLEDWEIDHPRRFRYRDLYVATDGFKEAGIIGTGGFGTVFKGKLANSDDLIAVKKIIPNSRQGVREFMAEIESLGRVRHRNLVNLQGWCKHRTDLLLIYDYIPNGSLDSLLYSVPRRSGAVLPWNARFEIAKGIASGLLYLHEEWEQIVVHRDVKPSNVLIESNMNPRLGDFGLLARNGKPSSASDAYAFGVLLLEIVCGRKPTDSGTFFLVDWVMGLHARGEILSAIDPRLGSDYDGEEARVALAVGLLCCHQNPASRPSMRGVLRFLNGEIDGDWGYSKSSRSDFGSKFVPSSSSKASSSSSFVTRITSTSRVTSGG